MSAASPSSPLPSTIWQALAAPPPRQNEPVLVRVLFSPTPSGNRELLDDHLRGRLGFQGAVISDWWDYSQFNRSLDGAVDLVMPGNQVAGIVSSGKWEAAAGGAALVRELLVLVMWWWYGVGVAPVGPMMAR